MSSDFAPVVYSLANRYRGGLYTGVTSTLVERNYQQRTESFGGYATARAIKQLVWLDLAEELGFPPL